MDSRCLHLGQIDSGPRQAIADFLFPGDCELFAAYQETLAPSFLTELPRPRPSLLRLWVLARWGPQHLHRTLSLDV